jgi:hypothetical protein
MDPATIDKAVSADEITFAPVADPVPGEPVPVFVSERGRRHHAFRLVMAMTGLLLAGWLAALATGLFGFSPLPDLVLPGGGNGDSAPAVKTQAAPGDGAGREAARAGERASAGTGDGSAGAGESGSANHANKDGGAAQSGTGGGATQAGTPSTSDVAQSENGKAPSYTPPASGEQRATPLRGRSDDAPAKGVTDPPGTAVGQLD